MTATQIQYFLAVSQEGSVSAAAERHFVSQPAVSKQIGLLEDELGFKLFDRSDRKIRLTDAGVILQECFTRCINDYKSTVEQINRRLGEPVGNLHLGCVEVWNASLFLDRINAHFQADGVACNVSVVAYPAGELVAALNNGEVDAALSYDFSFSKQSGLLVTPVTSLKCGILYSVEHLGKVSGKPKLEDFLQQPVLLLDAEIQHISLLLKQIFETYGFSINAKAFSRSSAAIMEAFCGHGIMLVSEWNNLISNSAFGYMPLDTAFPVSLAYVPGTTDERKIHLLKALAHVLQDDG